MACNKCNKSMVATSQYIDNGLPHYFLYFKNSFDYISSNDNQIRRINMLIKTNIYINDIRKLIKTNRKFRFLDVNDEANFLISNPDIKREDYVF